LGADATFTSSFISLIPKMSSRTDLETGRTNEQVIELSPINGNKSLKRKKSVKLEKEKKSKENKTPKNKKDKKRKDKYKEGQDNQGLIERTKASNGEQTDSLDDIKPSKVISYS